MPEPTHLGPQGQPDGPGRPAHPGRPGRPAHPAHPAGPGRRDFFRYSGAAAAVGTLAGAVARAGASASTPANLGPSATQRPAALVADAFTDNAASAEASPGDLATDPILPDPGFQNQTDDFAGSIAHSVNLALKGIVAVAAMSQIATAAGRAAEAASYRAQANQFIAYWTAHAQDPGGQHLDLTYNGTDGGNGTWGTCYNGFADRLLRTGLVPAAIQAEQSRWYQGVANTFGVPLQVPHSYAKSDWEMFTAAWLSDYPVKQELIDRVYTYAHTTPSRVPFSDLYDTIGDYQVGFQARPVQGGMFALLALLTSP